MGRSPCYSEDANMKKGPWTPEEDQKLIDFINKHGDRNWKILSKHAGLNRCGKSCRLRWTNYLRPDIKRGKFSEEEERIIINLHSVYGNKWSRIASHLPGRTDNEIKNFWNTQIRKRLLNMGLDPNTHKPRTDLSHLLNVSQVFCAAQLMNPLENTALKVEADASQAQLAQLQLLQNLLQILSINYNLSTMSAGLQNPYPFEGLVNYGTSFVNETAPAPPTIPQILHNNIAGSMSQTSSEFNHESPDISDFLTENTNFALASEFPEVSFRNQNEDKTNTNRFPDYSPDTCIFQAWEKLMDDETDDHDSFWKNILDLTSTPASPIEW